VAQKKFEFQTALLISIIALSGVISCGSGGMTENAVGEDALTENAVGEGVLTLSSREKELLAGADSRIEQYRMGTATLNVLGADGQPVAGADVEIEQTRHEFLFGANHSEAVWRVLTPIELDAWAEKDKPKPSESQTEQVRKYFYEFANYTALPVWWGLYEQREGQINYEAYDAGIKTLHENGMKVLAHNLVWNSTTPDWVPDDCDGISMETEKRVREFMSHYKGGFDYNLVFNEPSNPFRPPLEDDKMTKCFSELGKLPFVEKPFKTAREVDPDAVLMINEVSIGPDKGYPELLRDLKDSNGKPLYDLIGIQSHMHDKLWSLESLWNACEGYSYFNAPIHFTEVSILSGTPVAGNFGTKTTPEGEQIQAEYVKNFYTLLFSHPSVEAILWWNFSDFQAWKGAPAGLLREDMSPKPAYTALMDLIKNKWWTRAQRTTSYQGRCEFKGFFGKYRVTVTPKRGAAKTFEIDLGKRGPREFQIVL